MADCFPFSLADRTCDKFYYGRFNLLINLLVCLGCYNDFLFCCKPCFFMYYLLSSFVNFLLILNLIQISVSGSCKLQNPVLKASLLTDLAYFVRMSQNILSLAVILYDSVKFVIGCLISRMESGQTSPVFIVFEVILNNG